MSFQRKRKAGKSKERKVVNWAEHYAKSLDEGGGLSEKKILNLLRSVIRKAWMQSPVKLTFYHSKKMPEFRVGSRKSWIWQCESCNEYFGANEVEVDHKHGEHTLKSFDDLVDFSKSILGVTINDLQLLCIPCHEIKTYAERYNLSKEDAKIMKKVILLQKDKLDKQFLTDKGLKPASNATKRKDQLLEYFKTNGGLDSA